MEHELGKGLHDFVLRKTMNGWFAYSDDGAMLSGTGLIPEEDIARLLLALRGETSNKGEEK